MTLKSSAVEAVALHVISPVPVAMKFIEDYVSLVLQQMKYVICLLIHMKLSSPKHQGGFLNAGISSCIGRTGLM